MFRVGEEQRFSSSELPLNQTKHQAPGKSTMNSGKCPPKSRTEPSPPPPPPPPPSSAGVQSLSHNLKTGCPKLAIVKSLGLFFKGDYTILRLQKTNMYSLGKIRLSFFMQCHGNCIEVKKNQLYAWNWHLKKLLPQNVGVIQMVPRCPCPSVP